MKSIIFVFFLFAFVVSSAISKHIYNTFTYFRETNTCGPNGEGTRRCSEIGAICYTTVNPWSYICNCPPGHRKMQGLCRYDPCRQDSCKNNGVCEPVGDLISCKCPSYTSGPQCETVFDWCERAKVINGRAPCLRGTCLSMKDNYVCQCPTSLMYDKAKDECINNPCIPNPCKNKGNCHINGNTHRCTCPNYATGPNCETVTNWCEREKDLTGKLPCGTGTCKSMAGQYTCECPHGQMYDKNMDTCVNNPCIPNPCKNKGTCQINGNTHKCTCPNYATGPNCETVTNWCEREKDLTGKMPCGTGTCKSTAERYTCECPYGQMYDQKLDNCVNNPCVPNPCKNKGTCQINGNTHKCTCPNYAEGLNCERIKNWCERQRDLTGKIPCGTGTCKSLADRYTCECPYGQKYDINQDNCVNDPCVPNPCKNSGICHPNGNAHKCVCAKYADGPNCERITNWCDREKDLTGKTPCGSGSCRSLKDHFTCECPYGQMYDKNQDNCIKDPCVPNPCTNNGTCQSFVNMHKCICPVFADGPNCENIKNWCDKEKALKGKLPCGSGVCQSLKDQFTCQCLNGKQYDASKDDCIDEDACAPDGKGTIRCKPLNARCYYIGVNKQSYMCDCAPGDKWDSTGKCSSKGRQ